MMHLYLQALSASCLLLSRAGHFECNLEVEGIEHVHAYLTIAGEDNSKVDLKRQGYQKSWSDLALDFYP